MYISALVDAFPGSRTEQLKSLTLEHGTSRAVAVVAAQSLDFTQPLEAGRVGLHLKSWLNVL